MTGWITAGMCRSGSNLYMHYVKIYAVRCCAYISFLSNDLSTYTDIESLFINLEGRFSQNEIPCNGYVEVDTVADTIYSCSMDTLAKNLTVNLIQEDNNITTWYKLNASNIISVTDRVVPVLAS